jgi:hypothetical protein
MVKERHTMSNRTYWLDLFTGTTWREFLNAGGTVSGFREARWPAVQQIKSGDYLLCYLTGVSRWIGVLEVVSEPYKEDTPIWHDNSFPCRVKVRVLESLEPDTAVPIMELRSKLSIFQQMSGPNAWTGRLRGSPARWNVADGEAVVQAVRDAKAHPVHRPFNIRDLERRPRILQAEQLGSVTVPESEEQGAIEDKGEGTRRSNTSAESREVARDETEHVKTQWTLLKLGGDMGLDVWVARNDRGRGFNGQRIADLPRLITRLPLQFDEATNKTIELIDVLWLSGNRIVAAFEIECTTSIYSGLLRMSDLIAMQPNLNIPLYLVAPDERRDKVLSEVNRPTFSRLRPPMKQLCRFIAIPDLLQRIDQIAPVVRHLRPEFLVELSESCELDEV